MNAQQQLDPKLRRLLDDYLGRVSNAMSASGVEPRQINSVLEDIETQFFEQLAQRAAAPTEAGVSRVLAGFDDPAEYAQPSLTPGPAANPSFALPPVGPPRFSRLAIWGAIWAPMLFLGSTVLYFMMRPVIVTAEHPFVAPPWWVMSLVWLSMLVGFGAPFGTTIFGFVAISQIRHSGGRLTGIGLAFFDAALYPLLLLDAVMLLAIVLIFRAAGIMNGFANGAPWARIVLSTFGFAAFAAVLIVDFFVLKNGWNAAAKPAQPFCSPK